MSGALLTEWSRLLVASLWDAGLRHAVVCPGSRSTPFAWALAEHAGLRCHSLIDERVAAFFALGLARATGEPALVLSTSGTATANFYPAVVEASLSHTPLLLLTADRPLELQAAMAAQTIDQVKLYGDHARAFFDLGAPDPSPAALASVKRLAAQALFTARTPRPGPVQLNVRARKPLEPTSPGGPADAELTERVSGLLREGVTRVSPSRPGVEPEAVRALAASLLAAERGVLVCGPLPLGDERLAPAVAALSRRLGWPLFAEGTSQARFTKPQPALLADGLDGLLGSAAFLRSHAPDTVLRLGATPTSSALERLLGGASDAPALHVVSEHGHSDPSGRARTLMPAPPWLVVEALVEALGEGSPTPAQARYAERVTAANALLWRSVERVLERSTAVPGTSEPRAVRAVLEAMPERAVLAIGNSLPVRELDAYVPAGSARVRVASQRGANGIDGLVSGAAGTALASAAPTVVLLGDVSLVHDLGGLAAARLVRTPLAIVVLDNDGGRIFEELPVARLFAGRPERAELWLTPPRLELSHAAGLFRMPYVAPASVPELRTAVESALEHAGPTLVHVRVLPGSARETARGVLAELESALAAQTESGEP